MSLTSDVLYIFKKKYSDDAVAKDVARDHPLYARMKKTNGFSGEGQFYSIKTANPQGVSTDFSSAQTAITTSKGKKPYATRFTKYGIIRLKGEDMKAAPNGGAFYDYVTDQTDSIIEEVGDTMAFELYRDGTGARGRISSIAGEVLTLTVADDARNFKEGMTIVGDDAAAGTSPNAGSATVSSVDEDSGTVTLAAGGVAAANLIANDYLFRYGDNGACVEGLGLCTPLVAPIAGDSFRGIDRSTNVRRLAGVRINDTGTPLEENIGILAVKSKQAVRQAFDEFYVNPINFHSVVRRTNAKVCYENGSTDATIGFESITVATEAGMVKLVSDPDCPTNRGYGVRMSEHYLWHLDELPHVVRDAGKPALQVYNADSIELRIRAWWNYIQRLPGAFGVVSI